VEDTKHLQKSSEKINEDIFDIVNNTISEITNNVYSKPTKKSNYIENWRKSNLRDLIQEDRLCLALEQEDATQTADN